MKIQVKDVAPGMVLARDLKQQGRVLLKKGALISDVTIEILRKRDVSSVDIVYDGAGAAPGSAVLNAEEDKEYLEERKRIDDLFSTVDKDDEQMFVLRYCLIRQLKERHGE